jgi:hypothetical protein
MDLKSQILYLDLVLALAPKYLFHTGILRHNPAASSAWPSQFITRHPCMTLKPKRQPISFETSYCYPLLGSKRPMISI